MQFEILLATMFRTDLNFLKPILQHNLQENLSILIINQTDEDKLLHTNFANIRVINSFDRGTSASRNLAIKNAKGEICLFADDDTIFKPNIKQTILKEFTKHPEAYMLTFEAVNSENLPHLNYCKEGLHDKETLKTIHMIVMAVRPAILKKQEVWFHKYFSLGGKFSGGTEYVFLRNAYAHNLISYHKKISIVEHHEESSGKFVASNRAVHTRAAAKNHFSNNFIAHLWVIKYLFFLWRKDYISLKEIPEKWKFGKKGIKDYNDLLKLGKVNRQQ